MSEQTHMDYICVYPSQRLLWKFRLLFIKASSKYEMFAASHYTRQPSKMMEYLPIRLIKRKVMLIKVV